MFKSPASSYTGNLDITTTPEGGNTDLVRGHCKRIVFSYAFPSNAKYYVSHMAMNGLHDSGKYVTWCGLHVKKVGENFPCATINSVPWSPMPGYDSESDEIGPYTSDIDWSSNPVYDSTNTSMFYKRVANVVPLQHYQLTNNPDDDKVYVELSLRADKDIPAGTEIPIQFTVRFVQKDGTTGLLDFTKDVYLTVKDLTTDNSPETTYTKEMKANDAFLRIPRFDKPVSGSWSDFPNDYMKGNVRELIWVPFRIFFPIDGVFPFKLLVEAPTENKRAIFHLKTIQFPHFNCPEGGSGGWDFCSDVDIVHNSQGHPDNPGQNMLGTSMWIDIERVYDMKKIKSTDNNSHMQVDKIFVDFGFITNAAYTKMWSDNEGKKGHSVLFYAGVEISDHHAATHQSVHNITITASISDMIITTGVPIQVVRNATKADRQLNTRTFLDFNLTQVGNPATIYEKDQVVNFTAIVRHSSTSLAEGSPAAVRILMDQYVGFVVGTNEVHTNYTGPSPTLLVRDESKRHGSMVDIFFPSGILFPDTIEVNFTVTIDPYGRRRPEDNDALKSTVKMTALGDLSAHGTDEDWPQVNPVPLAGFEHVSISTETKECRDPIVWLNKDQQIQASYVKSWEPEFSPAMATSTNFSWQAPIRSGPHWIDNYWLQFDMLAVKKITQVEIWSPANSRGPQRVRFDYSNSGSPQSFVPGQVKAVPAGDHIIRFNPALYTRFLRFVVVETNAVTENLKPVEMNKIKVYGCDAETFISDIVQTELTDGTTKKPQRQKTASYTLPNTTISSTDVVNYRHFAVHPDKDIIYMCDRNPYRADAGSICYVSTDGGNLWIDQPKYIHNIVGYSPKTGRMYFQDKTGKAYLSSTDGIRMEVTNPSKMDDITSDSNFLPAVNIPGLDYKTLNDLNTKFGDIDTYRGIKSIIKMPHTCIEIYYQLLFLSGVRRRPKS